MMYACIAKLPFFDQFKIDNKELLIKELINGNSGINNEGKVYNVDSGKNINDENSSNIILTNKKNDNNYEENKKKCGC